MLRAAPVSWPHTYASIFLWIGDLVGGFILFPYCPFRTFLFFPLHRHRNCRRRGRLNALKLRLDTADSIRCLALFPPDSGEKTDRTEHRCEERCHPPGIGVAAVDECAALLPQRVRTGSDLPHFHIDQAAELLRQRLEGSQKLTCNLTGASADV